MKALHVGRVSLTLLISHEGKFEIFVQHIFYVCPFLFVFYHEIWIYVNKSIKEKKTSKSGISDM